MLVASYYNLPQFICILSSIRTTHHIMVSELGYSVSVHGHQGVLADDCHNTAVIDSILLNRSMCTDR